MGEIDESWDAPQLGIVAESLMCRKKMISLGIVVANVIAPDGGIVKESGEEQV